jgi:TIR domain
MAPIPIQKRPNDLFVSYGYADKTLVDPIVDWLHRAAGLRVWYDAVTGDASKRNTTLLSNAIQSARGAVFFLSRSWEASAWCQDEHELVLAERRTNNAFLLVAVRIDDLEIPPWFRIANVIDFRHIEARTASDFLRSLVPNPPVRVDNDQDVYFAGPWSRPNTATKSKLRLLLEMGWRLVGDAPDHPHFDDARKRIASIIATSRGLVAVLPFLKDKPPDNTSPWILDEIRIALSCGHPYLLVAENGVNIQAELVAGAFGNDVIPLGSDGPDTSFQQILTNFDDLLTRRPHCDARAFSFLATSLLGDQRDADDLISVIERTSNMTCLRGQGFTGRHVQKAIIERIRDAAFVIADVSEDNRNSLIEAGVALGAGTPLHLLCRLRPEDSRKIRFMFEDMEMNWYANPLERLGAVYRIAKMYRRQILTPV